MAESTNREFATDRVDDVTPAGRNHVEMGVSHGLAGGLANVDADVVAIRRGLRGHVVGDRGEQGPDCRLLLGRQRKEVGLVPPRNDKAVTRADWEPVWEGDGQVVVGDEATGR